MVLVSAVGQTENSPWQTVTYPSQDRDSVTTVLVQVHLDRLVSTAPGHAFALPHVTAGLVEVDN